MQRPQPRSLPHGQSGPPRAVALLLAVAPLALGCASPSPQYLGVTPTHVTVDGTEIAVWQRGDRAQAIRMGRAARGEHGLIAARMHHAAEQATGCKAAPVGGDTGVMDFRLTC